MEEIKVSKIDFKGNKILIEMLFNKIMVGYIDLEKNSNNKCFKDLFVSENYIYVNEVFVDKNFRRRGIANKLMARLNSVCLRYFPGFNEIVLTVYPMEKNISFKILQKFYEKYGFEKIGTKTMFKNLPLKSPIEMRKKFEYV